MAAASQLGPVGRIQLILSAENVSFNGAVPSITKSGIFSRALLS